MLQPSMFSQLARVTRNNRRYASTNLRTSARNNAASISISYPGPMTVNYMRARKILEILGPDEKHWFAGGPKSSAVALRILEKNDVIAVPTDTIYGFAALAQSKEAIDRLYAIKGRDETKPLAITLGHVADIERWAEIDHLPPRLLRRLLPGPVTVVLKRKNTLNPSLNPGHETVGIRVPRTKFIRHICNVIQQPLALTSANISNEPSTLHPDEFSNLWPKLGAIFYEIFKPRTMLDSQRVGSTVVDLTVPGEFEILRRGVRFSEHLEILENCGVRREPVASSDETLELRRESNA